LLKTSFLLQQTGKTDWLIANCYLQEQILNNSKKPIECAYSRYALLPYASHLKKNSIETSMLVETFQVESWLNYHGKTRKRFQLSAYKMMNQLLKTIDILAIESLESLISKVEANIHCRDQFSLFSRQGE
jgi:hypothetical protein